MIRFPVMSRALLAFLCTLLLLPLGAIAQSYPTKPITLIVTFPAGGPVDTLARIIATELGKTLGKPVIVEYRAGASGNIGAEYVSKAPADGYTMMITASGTLTINPHVYKSLPFDPEKSFAAIAMPARLNLILMVNPKLNVSTLQEFVNVMKAQPGKLNFGSAGVGSLPHLAGELVGLRVGTKANHIPYKGVAPALSDLVAGQIDFLFQTGSAVPYIRSGKLRALAVVGPNRLATLPDVATFKELGVEGMEVVGGWHGIFAPAGTPRPIVELLNSEVVRIVAMASVKEKFTALGFEPTSSTPKEVAAALSSDLSGLSQLIKKMDMTF